MAPWEAQIDTTIEQGPDEVNWTKQVKCKASASRRARRSGNGIVGIGFGDPHVRTQGELSVYGLTPQPRGRRFTVLTSNQNALHAVGKPKSQFGQAILCQKYRSSKGSSAASDRAGSDFSRTDGTGEVNNTSKDLTIATAEGRVA